MQVQLRLLKHHYVARLSQQTCCQNGQHLADTDTHRREADPAIQVGRAHLDADTGATSSLHSDVL